jgi:myosin-5
MDEQHKNSCFHGGLTGGPELSNYFHLASQGGAPQLREFSDEDRLKYTLKSMRSIGVERGQD